MKSKPLWTLANIGAEFSRIIYGLLLVLVIMYLPHGLIGLSRREGREVGARAVVRAINGKNA